ncbi:MAG: enoyl-CoA hydratase/isomerase family protein [Pseudomonadota bacterium]
MSALRFETNDKTALITLTNGENKQDLDFAHALLDAIAKAEADKSIRSLVITADDEKNWSQGVNLNWLMAQMQGGGHDNIKAFMYAMNDVFAKLLTVPFPTIAAITGHAFGNGAILASSCDFRFMRQDRGYFCFPEVDVSIPFLPSMIETIATAVPRHRFHEMQLSGRRITADQALDDDILHAACPDAPATLAAAMEYAATFNKSRGIVGEHKRRSHRHILNLMQTEDPTYIDSLQLMA